jgi:hypothetical protein
MNIRLASVRLHFQEYESESYLFGFHFCNNWQANDLLAMQAANLVNLPENYVMKVRCVSALLQVACHLLIPF